MHPHSLLGGLDETLFDDVPVDDVPDGLDVVGSNVSVIDVISVLPDIDSEQGLQSGRRLHGILVGEGDHVDHLGLWIVNEPSPSGSLNGNGLGAHLRNHVVQASESSLNGSLERASGWELALGGEILPKQGVVDVSAPVELESALQGNGLRNVARNHGGVDLFQGSAEVGDVCLVVLRVVQFHGLRRDGWFQRVVVVGEIGEDEFRSRQSRKQRRRGLGDLGRKLG
mmetsp:Transcript_359/g.660  ORF Transcript_359/g.660 Transcript_359/m.660 type:complete len:226 (+) Transcript_359:1743-2420(+)